MASIEHRQSLDLDNEKELEFEIQNLSRGKTIAWLSHFSAQVTLGRLRQLLEDKMGRSGSSNACWKAGEVIVSLLRNSSEKCDRNVSSP